MEVISFLVGAVLVGVIGFMVFGMLAGLWSLFLHVWPGILGVTLGMVLWSGGADNAGAIAAIFGIVATFWWLGYADEKGIFRRMSFFNDDGASPMDGKRKHYDKSGNVRGYSDKD